MHAELIMPEAGNGPRPGSSDRHAQRQWWFNSTVHRVPAQEGEWLANELASVVRDLLDWAAHDMQHGNEPHDQERAA